MYAKTETDEEVLARRVYTDSSLSIFQEYEGFSSPTSNEVHQQQSTATTNTYKQLGQMIDNLTNSGKRINLRVLKRKTHQQMASTSGFPREGFMKIINRNEIEQETLLLEDQNEELKQQQVLLSPKKVQLRYASQPYQIKKHLPFDSAMRRTMMAVAQEPLRPVMIMLRKSRTTGGALLSGEVPEEEAGGKKIAQHGAFQGQQHQQQGGLVTQGGGFVLSTQKWDLTKVDADKFMLKSFYHQRKQLQLQQQQQQQLQIHLQQHVIQEEAENVKKTTKTNIQPRAIKRSQTDQVLTMAREKHLNCKQLVFGKDETSNAQNEHGGAQDAQLTTKGFDIIVDKKSNLSIVVGKRTSQDRKNSVPKLTKIMNLRDSQLGKTATESSGDKLLPNVSVQQAALFPEVLSQNSQAPIYFRVAREKFLPMIALQQGLQEKDANSSIKVSASEMVIREEKRLREERRNFGIEQQQQQQQQQQNCAATEGQKTQYLQQDQKTFRLTSQRSFIATSCNSAGAMTHNLHKSETLNSKNISALSSQISCFLKDSLKSSKYVRQHRALTQQTSSFFDIKEQFKY